MVIRPLAKQAGFTYVGLIILVGVIGLFTAAAMKTEAVIRRAQAEKELLEIGAEFSNALRSYAAATPAGQPMQPRSLSELLRDARFPEPRRHLRKIYLDPIAGKAEWGITYLASTDRIVGIHSLSPAMPLKVANFDSRFQGFENRRTYVEWVFTANGASIVRLGALERTGTPPR